MTGEDANFERLLMIQEKSIVAWDRAYEKLAQMQKTIEQDSEQWDRQFSEMKMMVVDRIRSDEQFTRWLKIVTALLGFISVIVGVVIAVKG
jgi:hypothetical protein